MSRRKQEPDPPGWVQVVVGLVVAISVTTAGVDHVIDMINPQPPTMCTQLKILARVLLATRGVGERSGVRNQPGSGPSASYNQ